MENKKPVGYDGVCPVCGSADGMIIFGNDGKYRTMCRVMGCAAWYKPCPRIGFDKEEDCRNPFDSEYLKDGTVSVAEYVLGKKAEESLCSKGYSPDNCRWATPKQQANNRRSNRKIAYNGEERNIAEWADYFGIESGKFNAAIQRGRTIEEILERERKNGNLSA